MNNDNSYFVAAEACLGPSSASASGTGATPTTRWRHSSSWTAHRPAGVDGPSDGGALLRRLDTTGSAHPSGTFAIRVPWPYGRGVGHGSSPHAGLKANRRGLPEPPPPHVPVSPSQGSPTGGAFCIPKGAVPMADTSKVHRRDLPPAGALESGEMPAAIATLTIRRQWVIVPPTPGPRQPAPGPSWPEPRTHGASVSGSRPAATSSRAPGRSTSSGRRPQGPGPRTAPPASPRRAPHPGLQGHTGLPPRGHRGRSSPGSDYAPQSCHPSPRWPRPGASGRPTAPDRGGGYYGAYSPTADRIELVTHAEMTFFTSWRHAAHRRLGGLPPAARIPARRSSPIPPRRRSASCRPAGYVAPAAGVRAGYAGVGADDAAHGALRHLGEIEACSSSSSTRPGSWRSEMEPA